MSDTRPHLAWAWTGSLGRWGGLEEIFCPGTGELSTSLLGGKGPVGQQVAN